MVEVDGRPFLDYLIELLKKNGIEEIVLLLGYQHEKITERYGDGSKFGVDVTYSIGEVSDETGTRVRNAKELLQDTFLLMYCDNYWPMSLEKITEFYNGQSVLASTTVYNNKDGHGEYGLENNIFVDESGRVILYDKTRRDTRLNGVDIGFFLLDKKILDFMPNRNFSFESEILPALAAQNQLVGFRTDHPYYPISSIDRLKRAERFLVPKKVVFLDRDGVINKQMPPHDYVKKWEEFEFLPHTIPALQLLKRGGYDIHIVTNQRGVARGLLTEEGLASIHDTMRRKLLQNGIEIGSIYYCPHDANRNCECRKPRSGMFFAAAREHYLDLTKTFFVGDSEEDWAAGEAAGCKTIIIEPNQNLLKVVHDILKTP